MINVITQKGTFLGWEGFLEHASSAPSTLPKTLPEAHIWIPRAPRMESENHQA